ncbi:RsmD family RNA methyltransferase [Bdellovibrio reynosensis]|uniref:RsmD family RNA methyltransferase n=1 Tax=Bdellovibrio reynosensis TaxID=2835041 RepID=A0ABY4CAX6_9BACT|nr:RsmD family RNA methyltransferase [Bdellovibrio reynosensis]UOF00836.1 RsmD family RNA methyltransferase [Bdellovibrio reynosensis]
MSSINPHFTFQYSQPEDYHFSHDSVFLARQVFELVQNHNLKDTRALDLCSGCGIIGLDFLYHCKQNKIPVPAQFDFLEVQDIYKNHFETNVQSLGTVSTRIHFLNHNYTELLKSESHRRYDLVLCNPPYFRAGQGKLSPSDFKNRCRFYLDSDFKSLLLALQNVLSDQGKAYILLRDLSDHGWNAFAEAQEILDQSITLKKVFEIRGTDVVCLSRK